MKKIAIIAPCILPVPALKGGAVEELVTCIINQNEISKSYAIDLYTIADSSYNSKDYSYTNIIPIPLDLFSIKLDRACDKYYRTIKTHSAKRLFDKQIVSAFLKRLAEIDESYYAVIVENQMSLAVELMKTMGVSRDFPIYFHMHNDVDIYRSPEYIRFLVENGVQFIAVSKYIKTQILKYSKEAVVHVLYNGISFEDYSKTTRKADGNIKFLYAGRVIQHKGVVELIEAFDKVLMTLPEDLKDKVTLDIIGCSDKHTAYEKLVLEKAMKYGKSISCQKHVSTGQLAEKYNEYDVVLMPTLIEESFGLVALETIAKGIPLITTNSGGIPEVVGEGAVIVEKEHDLVDQLANEMVRLAVDEGYRAEIGKKAYSEARRTVEFDINSYYYRLVNILDTECSQNKISVIVPVYNVEAQLKRCVASIINQTYTDLEIILVDDGSTDNSGAMCDELANSDSRIKVIHQSNKGLSGARNSGLDVATGDYVFFVDSDDYLDIVTMEKLLMQAQRCHADIVGCGFTHVFDNAGDAPFTSQLPGIWSGREAVHQMMKSNNLCTTAWNKLYKRGLWENIRFPEGRVHEDEATTYKLLYQSSIVAYLPECFYKYYQRGDSIMKAELEVRYADYVLAMKERIQFFQERQEWGLKDYSILLLLEYIKYVYRNVGGDYKGSIEVQYNELLREFGIPNSINVKKRIALTFWRFFKA